MMYDNTEYIGAGLACILLVGILTIKIILLIKPNPMTNYNKLSIANNIYSQEVFLDERKAEEKD